MENDISMCVEYNCPGCAVCKTASVSDSPEFALLGGEPRNVLPEKVVDHFAEYWCEPDRCKRDENLGGFIQRVAQYAIDHCK